MKGLNDAIFKKPTNGIHWLPEISDGDEVWTIIDTVKARLRV